MRFHRTTISSICVPILVAALGAASASAAGLTFPLERKWVVTLPSPASFSPAYDADHAYVALRNNQLVAVALEDGVIAWSVECPMNTAPSAGDGLVFVGGNVHIEARSKADGAKQWSRPVNDRVTSLFWDTGWLLATTEKGPVLALRAADGEILWERDFGAALHAAPAPAGDRLYLALADGRLVAASLKTGDEIWTRKMPQPAVGILALGDRLYLGSLDNRMYCLDPEDGHDNWKWLTGADILGMPVVDVRRVYFVALDNTLRAHDRNNGAMLWQRVLPMRPSSGPLISGDTLIVSGVATELRAHKTLDGAPAGAPFVLKGTQGEEIQLAAAPHLTPKDVVILTTKGGQLHALTSGAPPPPP